jgi:hypothetical protein
MAACIMKSNESESGGQINMKESRTVSPQRVTGLNDNLDFFGRQLHIQTENIGIPTPRIVTQVFCGGRVLFSRKSEYPPEVQEQGAMERIFDLMHLQHKRILKEISDKQKNMGHDK